VPRSDRCHGMIPAILIGLAAASVMGCACQKPRHGVILRGDWSLELNRVPWMNTRLNNYREDSLTMIPPPGALPVGGRSGCGENVGESSPDPAALPNSPALEHSGALCPGRGCGAAHAGGGMSAAEAGAPYNHSRFHPVPTRPVFAPDDRLAMANIGGASSAHPADWGAGDGAAYGYDHRGWKPAETPDGPQPPSTQPGTSPASPEAVPAPPGRPSPGASANRGRSLAQPRSSRDWMMTARQPQPFPTAPRLSKLPGPNR